MCHAPCCGTVEEMDRLIDEGFAGRLMLDDWDGQEDMIKPALFGSESERAPYEIRSILGCTFWKEGKCELHDLKLKPFQGRFASHANTNEQCDAIVEVIRETWISHRAGEVIDKWKKAVKYEDEEML